jgi:hypothetical protein
MADGRPSFPIRSLKQQALPFVAWVWRGTADVAGEESRLGRPGRWLVRAAAFALMLCALPVMAAAARLTGRAARRLTAHARQVWETSPFEAVALVRGVYDRLQAAAREGRRAGFRRLAIPAYGRFSSSDTEAVWLTLYDLEFAAGRFEEAHTLTAGMPNCAPLVLMRVECLLAMQRSDEAISLLESSLHLDDWNSSLRARLTALAGRGARGLN